MARNPFRALSLGGGIARRFSTAATEAVLPATESTGVSAGGRTAAAAAATQSTLYRRLSALSAVPGGSVEKTMNEWVSRGKMVTEIEVLNYVRELRKYRRHKHALDIMDWMEKRGMNISTGNHAIRLGLISKVNGTDAAETYFSRLPDIAKTQQTYGALLNCYCQDKMEDKAVALFEKMKALNFTSSTLVLSNLMTLYKMLGKYEKVLELFEEMKASKIPPDGYTCCIVMDSYAALDSIDSVERVVQEMKDEGLVLDWGVYSNLTAHYISAGLLQKAEITLKKLEKVMKKHDREPYTHLISLYARAGNLQEVNRIWKSLKVVFRKPTNMNYMVMLQALNKLEEFEALKQLFEEWQSTCAVYDIRLANIMIGVYLKKNMFSDAEALWKTALQKGGRSDFRTYELFIDYYMKNHEMDLAFKCFLDAACYLKDHQWKPDKGLLDGLLRYFQETKNVEGVGSFCRSLKKLNCLNGEANELLIHLYAESGKKDPLLCQQIIEDGFVDSAESERLLEKICTAN